MLFAPKIFPWLAEDAAPDTIAILSAYTTPKAMLKTKRRIVGRRRPTLKNLSNRMETDRNIQIRIDKEMMYKLLLPRDLHNPPVSIEVTPLVRVDIPITVEAMPKDTEKPLLMKDVKYGRSPPIENQIPN